MNIGDTYTSRPSRGAWIEIRLAALTEIKSWSRPSRGAWIEISDYGACWRLGCWSRPSRGAWIEMSDLSEEVESINGRAPRGARGLKCGSPRRDHPHRSRAPRGARGLKSKRICYPHQEAKSRAPRGARGLKFVLKTLFQSIFSSRPSRGAWIEMLMGLCQRPCYSSRPTRGASVKVVQRRGQPTT